MVRGFGVQYRRGVLCDLPIAAGGAGEEEQLGWGEGGGDQDAGEVCEDLATFMGGQLTYLHRTRKATQLQLLSDVCDSAVPSSALGYTNLDDGIVGLAGTVSSLIGLFAAWAKTA